MAGSPRPRPRPRQSLGQHFLADARILRRIVDALEPAPDDLVLEIGAGAGTLTRALLSRGVRVIAIEKDRRLAAECRMRNAECAIGRLEVVEGDALAFDWHALLSAPLAIPHSAFPVPHFKVVGNIPYYITSPLIDKALAPPLPERVVFLVQAEVADRLVAAPGSKRYGALSVGVQALCRVERLFAVKAGSFRPPPKVDSAVIRLRPLPTPLVDRQGMPRFREFVVACFSRRRKQLRNVMRSMTGRPAGSVDVGLAALGLAPQARPEAVTPEDFVRLWRWT